ncbi:class I SAM-dependent methyltransferase [Streptomyces sp. NPDC059866]|uniref:class I SAM-dependent methyltransferase n=1 Tax=Streptomyces sp. NPDC059866 TaxID=3346978 RepID=UPI00364699F2
MTPNSSSGRVPIRFAVCRCLRGASKLVGAAVPASEERTSALQGTRTGIEIARECVPLRFALCGWPADPWWQRAALRAAGQGDGLLGVVPVQRDQSPADQCVAGQCLVTAGCCRLDRALRPPQCRTFVAGLLHQPADIFGVPGAEGRQLPTGRAGHVEQNRRYWDDEAAAWHESLARDHWAQAEPRWGLWATPESEGSVLPDGIGGMRTIELGCGTAYVSAWPARAGAHPVGIDLSEKQLATARAMQAEFGIDFPLVLGKAEKVPYDDSAFDLVISEYGASFLRLRR